MFTGIVEATGSIEAIEHTADAAAANYARALRTRGVCPNSLALVAANID